MPWQRQVADVALEVNPVTGEWAYTTIVIIVQRQAGKSSLDGSVGVHRAVTGLDRGVWYTAQRRQDARDTWLLLVKRLRRSPLKTMIKIRESNGSEGITFPTGGEYRVFAPAADALHGKTIHMATVDEGWAFDDVRGDELTQAIVPGFTTVPGQLWVPSAAGTHRSTWLRGLVDTGTMFVEAGRTDTVAFFYWGIDDDVDPTDLAAVALAHPGYGYTLRPTGLIQAAATLKADQFARAYGSRWTGAGDRAIPALLWQAAQPPAPVELPDGAGAIAIAYDVGLDDADAAVVAAWSPSPGRMHVEVADVREGAAWVPGRLVGIEEERHPRLIAYDHYGPAVAVGAAAALLGVPQQATTTDEYVTACASFLAGLVAGTITYTPHPALDAAAAAVVKKPIGDRWAWGRRASSSTIATIVAATIAVWAYEHAPPPPQPFRVR